MKHLCIVLLLASAAFAQTKETGFVTTAEGVKLYYEKMGSGKQVVILPGRLFLFPEFEQLAHADRTVIAYDMRNRGKSSSVKDDSVLTIQEDVKDLEKLRQHFKVDKFSAVGYSYLGLMVVMYAMDHPDRIERLVQIGPVPLKFGTEYPKEFVADDFEQVVDMKEYNRLQELKKSGYHRDHPKEFCEMRWKNFRPALVGDPKKAETMESQCDMENEWPVNFDRHLAAHFGAIQKMEIPRSAVAKVTQPVLTLHGTKDRNAPYGGGREWAKELLPNARLRTVPGAAHQLFVDEPAVIAEVSEFLGGKWPAKAENLR